jgi:hypothetical protein
MTKAAPKKTAKPAPKKAPAKKAPVKKLTPAQLAAHAKGRPKREGEGRPSKYKPEFPEMARKFCLLGATDKRLAELFEVTESTISEWKLQHPEFSEAIYAGRDMADAEIAESLYHRAKGYSHEEDDIRTVALGGNQGSEIVITRTTKHYPPDTQAASLWLRNRHPQRWRDKVDIEHGGRLQLDQLPQEELDARFLELQARLGAVPIATALKAQVSKSTGRDNDPVSKATK